MPVPHPVAVVVLGCLLASCEGVIGGAASIDPADDPTDVLTSACDPNAAPDAELVRVHRGVYLEALRELIPADALEAASASLRSLPQTQSGRFVAEVEVPSFDVVRAYADIASTVAFAVSEGPALTELSPCLGALETPLRDTDEACLSEFIESFGARVFRHPLSDEERTRARGAYDIGAGTSPSEGVATLLMAMLLEPQFLYYLELDGEEVAPGVAELTSYEIAARLARTLWASIPDEALLEAAAAGFEGEEGEARLAAEIDRMWSDPRTEATVGQFYRDWLELDESAASDALVRFTSHVTYVEDGGMDALFSSRVAFVEDDTLAGIYGLPEGTRGQVELDPGRRAGLLTRAAWLQTTPVPSSNAGHIIHRGAGLSEVLCMPIPPPPPNAFPADDPAEPSGDRQTIRERFAEVTQDAPCSNCHVRLDNFGAVFGHYGSGGEWIDEEEIDFEGERFAMAIDTAAQMSLGGEPSVGLSDAVELSEVAAQSEHVASCLSAQLAENLLARSIRSSDACLVESARDELHGREGSVREALAALVRSPAFSLRSLPESP